MKPVDPLIIHTLTDLYRYVVPEMVLFFVGVCVLILGATVRVAVSYRLRRTTPGGLVSDAPERELGGRHIWGTFTLIVLALAMLAQWDASRGPHPLPTYQLSPPAAEAAPVANLALAGVSPIRADELTWFVKWLALFSAVVLVLVGWDEVGDRFAAEYYACLLVASTGVMFVGAANDLVLLYLALEMISIPTYIMLYLPKYSLETQEAAIKYFLLSIFSSALMLFGFSYLYGLTGSTNITVILQAFTAAPAEGSEHFYLAVMAALMIVAGFGYKVAAAPFHFYAPDVYQGAPTAPVAVLAYLPKVAGFVAFMRVLGYVGSTHAGGLAFGDQVPVLLWILAAVSMTLGNVMALLQDNLKRMLAYSGVAHAGYMLIGLTTGPALFAQRGMPGSVLGGAEIVLFYLIAYGAMTVAVFAALAYLQSKERPIENVDDLAGLSEAHPGVALLLALAVVSLIGMPFTAGFVGKLLLFTGAFLAPTGPANPGNWFWVLAIVGGINAAIAAYYYLRILSTMYFRTAIKPIVAGGGQPQYIALVLCSLVTFAAGVYPWPLLKAGRQAIVQPEGAALPTDARADAGR